MHFEEKLQSFERERITHREKEIGTKFDQTKKIVVHKNVFTWKALNIDNY
jgi:hypothetical protein